MSKRKEQVQAVVYMIIIASVFTALVSGVNVLMIDGIRLNEQVRNTRGVLEAFSLLPENAAPGKITTLSEKFLVPLQKDGITYFRYTDENGTVRGYAFPLEGEGYWGPIYGFLAVDPLGKTILGISITKHTETPGLGGRIAEPWFTNQFRGRSLDPDKNNNNPLRLVQGGKKKNPQDVDAITGATGTSTAFEVILADTFTKIRSVLGSR